MLTHIGGRVNPDIELIAEICKNKGVSLIEDCAHSLGSTFKGKHTGLFGDAGVYSLYATKAIPVGEGGIILTNNDELNEIASKFIMYDRFEQKLDIGINLRMSEINALLSYSVLKETEAIIKNKYLIAEKYCDACNKVDLEYLDPISALQPMIHDNIKYIDVMALQFQDFVEYSINILGWGLVSDIASFAEKIRFFGQLRYDIASLYSILKLKKRDCTIIINDTKYHDKYLFILIQNTIHTGKGMKAAPKAKLDDGLIDIVLVNKEVNRFQLIQLLSKLFNGSHIKSKYVQYMQVKNIELIPAIDEAINIDGDVKHTTPVKIAVLEKKLPIYY